MYAKKIIDIDKEESDEILNKIFAHQERLDFTCRCQWTANVLAIWDNRSAIHQSLTDFFQTEGWITKELWIE
ncbi:MAG: TauD/TfdA family dioxygenase [Alphaproteobacteria bacterium]|jgi:taurine dioxygenase|nr:TauD/TfdA family dioxygenase [Alphaproteobacteria bacterium]|tara:strand:- start:3755 stop:3970 length:216 start_codon:yes stop_codon:yes gene_type:complete